MKQHFCNYEISIKLKELGFDEECFSAYRNTDGEKSLMGLDKWTNSGNGHYNLTEGYCAAPLWQQVIDWFRETHNMMIQIGDNCGFGEKGFSYGISKLQGNKVIARKGNSLKMTDPLFNSYNEARESAILKAIEIKKK